MATKTHASPDMQSPSKQDSQQPSTEADSQGKSSLRMTLQASKPGLLGKLTFGL